MEPVSALSLASVVVQFISFASQILATAVSSDSSDGAAADIASLDDVYSRLQALGRNLGTASHVAEHAIVSEGLGRPGQSQLGQPAALVAQVGEPIETIQQTPLTILRDSYTSLRTLLSSCQSESKRILKIVERLKVKHDPSSRWSNVSTTIKMIVKRGRIAQIEERLKRYQGMVSSEMCKISM